MQEIYIILIYLLNMVMIIKLMFVQEFMVKIYEG